MSRNRLQDLVAPSPMQNDSQTYEQGEYNRFDKERTGERYELQDRTGQKFDLNEFLTEINDNREAMLRLDPQISRIEQLHDEAMANLEITSHAEVDSLIASATSLINSIKANLERLGNDAKKGGENAGKKADQVNTQRKRLQERVHRLQKVEQAYRDKLRDRAIRQYRIINPDISDHELSSALSDPQTQIFQQALLSSTRSSQARSTLSEVQSRHNDILDIERKLAELAAMFNELAVTVQFGEVNIDNAYKQAEDVQDKNRQGLESLNRTTEIMKAIRRKKWCCFLISVLIVIIVVAVPVVITQVNKSNNRKNGN